MSNGRNSGESFRPRRRTTSSNNDSTPPSPVTPSYPFQTGTESTTEPVSILKGHHSTRQTPSRVIRTFEEIEVEKVVMTEEWYEELECGICAHILGAPHALVPCGHTFCGPCAWQWIRGNRNHTCPHCRMEVIEGTPFVPNIVVDQIIERKLKVLPDGLQKMDMLVERQEKAEAWKLHLASLPAVKPPPRRPRGLDDIMMNLLDYTAPQDRSDGHRRRASRHYAELGAPLIRPQARQQIQNYLPQYIDRNVDQLWGGQINEDPEGSFTPRIEARRMRENMMRDQPGVLRPLQEEVEPEVSSRREREGSASYFRPRGGSNVGGPRPVSASRPIPLPPALPARPQSGSQPLQSIPSTFRQPPANSSTESTRQPTVPPLPQRTGGPHAANIMLGRPTPLRSTILASRQARGRTHASGSRDQPLVVLSDSD